MNRSLCLILLYLYSTCGFSQSVDDRIRNQCGTHPVIAYLQEFKGSLMDPQIVTRAEECARGQAKAEIWKWDLADANIQGCLERNYSYEKSYIDSIAGQFDEAREVVGAQIDPFNECATNVRQCGRTVCPDKDAALNGPRYVILDSSGEPQLELGIYTAIATCNSELPSWQTKLNKGSANNCGLLPKIMWCFEAIFHDETKLQCYRSQDTCSDLYSLVEDADTPISCSPTSTANL